MTRSLFSGKSAQSLFIYAVIGIGVPLLLFAGTKSSVPQAQKTVKNLLPGDRFRSPHAYSLPTVFVVIEPTRLDSGTVYARSSHGDAMHVPLSAITEILS